MSKYTFDGSEYNHKRDGGRLSAQYDRVFALMKDGCERSLQQISEATGDPEASISARLRDMRKPRFGGHSVSKRYLGNGNYNYCLVVNNSPVVELTPSEESEEEYVRLDDGKLAHRAIAEEIMERDLLPTEIVHHIDGDTKNNSIKNLCVLDREKHEFFHSWLQWKKNKEGRYTDLDTEKRILVSEYGGILLETFNVP